MQDIAGTTQDQATWLATASITPGRPVATGTFGTWTLTIVVGRYGIDNSGAVKVAIRSVTDWGQPQLDDPAGDNHVTVAHTGQASLRVSYEPLGGVRPWSRVLWLQVRDGSLAEGDRITVTWGDTSGGSRGARAQSYPEAAFEFRVFVDSFGTGLFETLNDSPTLAVVPDEVDHLAAVTPSTLHAGEPGWLLIRTEDVWGNATPVEGRLQLLDAPGLPDEVILSVEDGGVRRLEGLSFADAGLYRVRVRDAEGREAISNPIMVAAPADGYRLLWGDTQGQSGGTVGTGSLDAFYQYARDVGALDFVVHSGNDFQITADLWQRTQEANRHYHEPGRFVTFLSYEWSGNTPGGGDHNVIFMGDHETLHRSSHWQVPDKSDQATDRYPVSRLWETFEGRDDVLAVPHVGGRRADLSFLDERFCPVVEISSVHGQFEWFGREALELGHHVGFVGASDDHSGRPGRSTPTSSAKLPVKGGFAGVFAAELTREGIWEALRARRCYATTGERIVLEVRADEHWMGERIEVETPPQLRIRVAGTGPIERLDVFRDSQIVHSERIAEPGDAIRIAWMGARVDTRGRHQRWDGGLRLSEGQILEATAWSFDSPADWLEQVGDRDVRWHSGTSGDADGVLLRLDTPPGATLDFDTPPATHTFAVDDLGLDPVELDLGGIERRVVVDRAPRMDGPWEAEHRWRDEAPPAGEHAYWVRVTQVDGDIAWSSPIFITLPT